MEDKDVFKMKMLCIHMQFLKNTSYFEQWIASQPVKEAAICS